MAGIGIDPDFATNHYIYVSYTGADNHERLARLTISGYTGDPPTSETLSAGAENVLYRVTDEAANYHQGGGIQFGPDGKLYWSLGDNFDFSNSQSLDNPHGKILRLDVRNLNADGTATAPADNPPFVNTPGALPEIYAYGLRNPFRFVFTPPTGQILEADVGGAAWEEINVITAGANYGWPLAEGNCSGCAFVNPLYTYAHTGPPLYAGGAISSILVYTGDALGAQYTNKVFIADYAQQWMKDLSFDSQYSSFIGENMFDEAAGTTVQLLQGAGRKHLSAHHLSRHAVDDRAHRGQPRADSQDHGDPPALRVFATDSGLLVWRVIRSRRHTADVLVGLRRPEQLHRRVHRRQSDLELHRRRHLHRDVDGQ